MENHDHPRREWIVHKRNLTMMLINSEILNISKFTYDKLIIDKYLSFTFIFLNFLILNVT